MAVAFALGFAAGCGGGGHHVDFFTQGGVDVAVDEERLAESWYVVDHDFPPGHCAIVEGAVPGPGVRRLLRFDVLIVNHGTDDVILGSPTSPFPPLTAADFVYSPCHGHYHFEGWSDYHLEDALGNVVAVGHKEAFCLRDSVDMSGGTSPSHAFTCGDQGITSGWADLYDAALDGQWVDVTGVPQGDYWLVVTVNAEGKVPEVDVWPDTSRAKVHVPDPLMPP